VATIFRGGTVVLALFLVLPQAFAYLPLGPPDCTLARASLIVVGRIKPGSVEYMPHEEKWGKATISRFTARANLVVGEVAAGHLGPREITIWFRGGALPLIGGAFDWQFGGYPPRRHIHVRDDGGKEFPEGSIQIGELNTGFYRRHDIRDLREDHLWFLDAHEGLPGLKTGEQAWCADSWWHVHSLASKDYFLAYRAADPKAALSAQLAKHPDREDVIRNYLDYLDAADCRGIADPAERARRLLPFFLRNTACGGGGPSAGQTAKECLLKAGDPAGRVVLAELPKVKDADARCWAIALLGELKYQPAVDPLVQLLRATNAAWKGLKPRPAPAGTPGPADESKDWVETVVRKKVKRAKSSPRAADDGASEELRLRDAIEDIGAIVDALGELEDRRAQPVLDATSQQWGRLGYDGIVDRCRESLHRINGTQPGKRD
jgi:hypothetical protein